MDYVLEIVSPALQELLVTVLLALISLGAGYAINYIHHAKRRLQAGTDLEIAERIIERTALLAQSTVIALEGTVARDLRQAVREGRATSEELQAVGRRAVEDILDHLGTEGQEVLAGVVGDAQDYVTDLVEAQVESMKDRHGLRRRVEELTDPKASASG